MQQRNQHLWTSQIANTTQITRLRDAMLTCRTPATRLALAELPDYVCVAWTHVLFCAVTFVTFIFFLDRCSHFVMSFQLNVSASAIACCMRWGCMWTVHLQWVCTRHISARTDVFPFPRTKKVRHWREIIFRLTQRHVETAWHSVRSSIFKAPNLFSDII